MKFTIDHDCISALLLAAAKNDVRYYLNGVLVDARQGATGSDVTLVSTEGHILLALPVPRENVEGFEPGQWIISRDMLESVKPAKAGRYALPLAVEIVQAESYQDDAGRTCRPLPVVTVTGATSATGAPVDGRFPEWRRVMPVGVASRPEVPAQFNPDYISTFGKIARLLAGKKEAGGYIHQAGNNSALVSCLARDALGILMPWRVETSYTGLPAWAWVDAAAAPARDAAAATEDAA